MLTWRSSSRADLGEMRRNGRHLFLLILLVAVLACAPSRQGEVASPDTLERYVEIELDRLEETYRLLDRFAEDIWPQWDNYHEIEVRVHFPNGVLLLVNPRGNIESGFEPIRGRTVHGKSIFIYRELQSAV